MVNYQIEPIEAPIELTLSGADNVKKEIEIEGKKYQAILNEYGQLVVRVNTDDGIREVQAFANDVDKALDPAKVIEYEDRWNKLTVAKKLAGDELRRIKKLFDEGVVGKDELVRAQGEFNNLSKATTEAGRELSNYRNTGDKDLSRLQSKFDSVNETIKEQGNLVGKLGTAFESAKRFAGGFLAIFSSLRGAYSLAREAIEAESAINRLNQILRVTTGASDEQIKVLNEQAQALEKLGVVSAENITTTQSQLATFDLQIDTIKQLTPAILDYVTAEKGALATTEDFKALTNGLAQAMQGNFASLTRTGFVLDDVTKAMIATGTEQEKAIALTNVLNSTYKDFNANLRGTAQGGLALLKNNFSALKEELGNFFIPVLKAVLDVVNPLIVRLTNFAKDSPKIAGGITIIATAVGVLAGAIAIAGGPITLIAVALSGLLVAGIGFSNFIINEFIPAVSKSRTEVQQLETQLYKLDKALKQNEKEVSKLEEKFRKGKIGIQEYADEILRLKQEEEELLKVKAEVQARLDTLNSITDKAKEATERYNKAIMDGKKAQSDLSKEAEELKKKFDDGKLSIEEYQEALAVLDDEYGNHEETMKIAQDELDLVTTALDLARTGALDYASAMEIAGFDGLKTTLSREELQKIQIEFNKTIDSQIALLKSTSELNKVTAGFGLQLGGVQSVTDLAIKNMEKQKKVIGDVTIATKDSNQENVESAKTIKQLKDRQSVLRGEIEDTVKGSKEYIQKQKELNEISRQLGETTKGGSKKVEELNQKYARLQKELDGLVVGTDKFNQKQKELNEVQKEIEKQSGRTRGEIKKEQEAIEANMKKIKDSAKDAFEDGMDRQIEGTQSRIKDLIKDIEGIKKALEDLEKGKDEDIASRVVTIDEEREKNAERINKLTQDLANIDPSQNYDNFLKIQQEINDLLAENAKLASERQEAFVGLDEEEIQKLQDLIDKQKEYNSLTDIGKIKFDYEEKKKILEQELIDKETALQNEQQLMLKYQGMKEALLERGKLKEFEIANQLIAKREAVARARELGLGGSMAGEFLASQSQGGAGINNTSQTVNNINIQIAGTGLSQQQLQQAIENAILGNNS